VKTKGVESEKCVQRKRGAKLPVGFSREPSTGAGGGDESHGNELLGVAVVRVVYSHLQYSNAQHE
jgi:hypothetical protein